MKKRYNSFLLLKNISVYFDYRKENLIAKILPIMDRNQHLQSIESPAHLYLLIKKNIIHRSLYITKCIMSI